MERSRIPCRHSAGPAIDADQILIVVYAFISESRFHCVIIFGKPCGPENNSFFIPSNGTGKHERISNVFN
jgi:hypothetical protein